MINCASDWQVYIYREREGRGAVCETYYRYSPRLLVCVLRLVFHCKCGTLYQFEPKQFDPPQQRTRAFRHSNGTSKRISPRCTAVWIFKPTEQAVCTEPATISTKTESSQLTRKVQRELFCCSLPVASGQIFVSVILHSLNSYE